MPTLGTTGRLAAGVAQTLKELSSEVLLSGLTLALPSAQSYQIKGEKVKVLVRVLVCVRALEKGFSRRIRGLKTSSKGLLFL